MVPRQLQGAGGGGGGGGGGFGGGYSSSTRVYVHSSGSRQECVGRGCVVGPLLVFGIVLLLILCKRWRNLSWRAVPSHRAWLDPAQHTGSRSLLSSITRKRHRLKQDRHTAALVEGVESCAVRAGHIAGSHSHVRGNYVGLYWQYGWAHVIPAQSLEVHPDGTVVGAGFDDVGHFSIDGSCSGARLALSKKYARGTGNPRENKGHTVELRLLNCVLAESAPPLHGLARPQHDLARYGAPPHAIGWFGTWHVRTFNYRGDAMMALWLPPTHVPVGYVIEPVMGTAIGSVPQGVPIVVAGVAVADEALPMAVPVGMEVEAGPGRC